MFFRHRNALPAPSLGLRRPRLPPEGTGVRGPKSEVFNAALGDFPVRRRRATCRGSCYLSPLTENPGIRGMHQQVRIVNIMFLLRNFWMSPGFIFILCCVFHLRRLMQLHKSVVKGSGSLPNELLYGRVGFLFSLIFINQQFQQEKIPKQYIQQVGLYCIKHNQT